MADWIPHKRLTISALWTKSADRNLVKLFYYLFLLPETKSLKFHANYLVMRKFAGNSKICWETIRMGYQVLFKKKKKKITSSAAVFSSSRSKVKEERWQQRREPLSNHFFDRNKCHMRTRPSAQPCDQLAISFPYRIHMNSKRPFIH